MRVGLGWIGSLDPGPEFRLRKPTNCYCSLCCTRA